MSNKVRIRALAYATKKEIINHSESEILKRLSEKLSKELSHHILTREDIYETQKTPEDGLQIKVECYVLTPKDYFELVEKIQHDLMGPGLTSTIL